MKKRKVGVVGLGKQAMESHLPAVESSDKIVLQAICDIDKNKLIDLKKTFNTKKERPIFL